MHVVSGVAHQKCGRIVDGRVITSTLNWAKKMVVKVWEVNGLVDHKVMHLSGLWVIISMASANGGVLGLSTEGWVIAFIHNRSVNIKEN